MSQAVKISVAQSVRSSLQPQWLPEYKHVYGNSEVVTIGPISNVTTHESIVRAQS